MLNFQRGFFIGGAVVRAVVERMFCHEAFIVVGRDCLQLISNRFDVWLQPSVFSSPASSFLIACDVSNSNRATKRDSNYFFLVVIVSSSVWSPTAAG